MHKKDLLRILLYVLVTMFVFFALYNYVGISNGGTGLDDGASKFGTSFDPDPPSSTKDSLDKGTNMVMSVVKIISSTIAIVTLMVLGIKYIVSAPGERADIKKHAVVYVVGAFLLFAVPNVIDALIRLSESFSKSS